MRQGLWVVSLFLMAAIVGCGSSGAYKSASLANASSTVNSSTAGSSAATPPSSGSSSNSGSSSTGTSSGSSSSPAPSGGAEVAITSPGDGATVSSPTQVTTSVAGSVIINTTQLYVDGAMAFQAASPQVNTAVQISPGEHTIVAQAWDQNGNTYKSSAVRVTVQGSAPSAPAPPAPPSAPAPNAGQIQTLSGWDSCGSCAGQGGQGPDTPHSMQQGVSSPALSGSSASFNASGSPWGDALWWYELGSHDDAQNMTYDLDFYIDDSVANAQAIEFDVNQTVGGSKYIFGTECDFRGSGTFRVWNGPAATWATTGLSCPVPQPNTWHHLTWEFQRSGGQAHFVAVTLDGNRQSVGMAFDGTPLSGSGLDVAFQIDLMSSGAGVTAWLDNVNLSW